MQVGGQRHAPAALTPGKTRYPLYRRLGGHQGADNLVPTGIRSPDRPSRSESLYRLNYRGTHIAAVNFEIKFGKEKEWINNIKAYSRFILPKFGPKRS
jgi:hypothetical protein